MPEQEVPEEIQRVIKLLSNTFPNGWSLVAKTTRLAIPGTPNSTILTNYPDQTPPEEVIGAAMTLMAQMCQATGLPVAIVPAQAQVRRAPPPPNPHILE